MVYQLQLKGECVVNDDFYTIERRLKALEIMKNYINVDKDENGLCWINLIGCASIGITPEEYEILKEVLL